MLVTSVIFVNQYIEAHLNRHSLLKFRNDTSIKHIIFRRNIFIMTLLCALLIFFICYCVKTLTLFTSIIIFLTLKILFAIISLAINPNVTSHSY